MSEGGEERVTAGETLWTPPEDIERRSCIGEFLGWARERFQRRFADYDELWQWSVGEPTAFWGALIDFFEIGFHDAATSVLSGDGVADVDWFPGATLNYAEQLLTRMDDGATIVALWDTRDRVVLSRDDVRHRVASVAAALRERGVGPGDRVAGYLPNIPEAIIAFLATASVGAVWSLIPPEFGARAAVSRLSQFRPDVLFCVDGYCYGEREFDRRGEVDEIRGALASLRLTVSEPYLFEESAAGALSWDDMITVEASERFEHVPFEHPLYVLYSSGTTGPLRPSCTGMGAWSSSTSSRWGSRTTWAAATTSTGTRRRRGWRGISAYRP